MKKNIYIAGDIRNKILNGEYQANQQLPFEKDLCQIYEASKMTVKKALDTLVAEGLIIKRRGSGTFVKDLSIAEIEKVAVANQFRGLTASNAEKKVSSAILDFSVIVPSETIQRKLNIDAERFVYEIYRVRYLDERPTVMERMFMPVDIIPGLKKRHIENSIYEYIEGELGLKIQSAHRSVSVRKATDIEIKYLKLETGDPVAVVEQTAFFDTGSAFEFSISVHRYDEFSVEFVLNRDLT